MKKVLVTSLSIAGFAGLAYILGWSSLLSIDKISIEGTSAQSEIQKKLQIDKVEPIVGNQLARVQNRAIEQSLTKLDWLASSEVFRNWLERSVQIQVKERVAVARALNEKNQMVNFDSEGNIFKPTSDIQKQKQENLALVSTAGSSKQDLADVALLIRMIPIELEYLIDDLEQIAVTKTGSILMQSLINQNKVEINWGGIDLIEQKFIVLKALIKLPENKGLSRIDLSEPNAPVVK